MQAGTQGDLLPYSWEEILTITAEHTLKKNYYEAGINVCRICFDILDTHVADAYKKVPASALSTIGWNPLMLPNKIFEHLMSTYNKPSPDAMRQHNLTFISTYNPKDPPKLLFKCCADCQEVAIVAKVPYMSKKLLMNVDNLFTRSGIYTHDIDNWECKAEADKIYVNLHPFIQAANQRCLASGIITAMQSGYASNICFAHLTTKDNISDNGTADTIVELIATHMANLSVSVLLQAITTNHANTANFNTSMQQVVANKAQCTQEHNHMVQQFAMMLTAPSIVQQFAGQQVGWPHAATQHNFIPRAIPNFAPTQQWGQPPGGARGSSCSRNRCSRCNPCSPALPGAPLTFVGGTQMVPFSNGAAISYILANMQPAQQQNPRFSNVTKQWVNQNVGFTCRFDIEDWHTSAMCPRKKMGHMDGFTHSNYMEYEWANHQFCCKVMHKTMYLQM